MANGGNKRKRLTAKDLSVLTQDNPDLLDVGVSEGENNKDVSSDSRSSNGKKRRRLTGADIVALSGRKEDQSYAPNITAYSPMGMHEESQYVDKYLPGVDVMGTAVESQSGIDQFANFIGRTAGTLTGQTLEGAGYLADLASASYLWSDAEEYTGNVLSELGKDIREGTRESLPIYTPFEAGEFKPGDPRFWAKHGDTLVSSISFLIPSRAAILGMRQVGRMTKTLRKMDDVLTGKFGKSASRKIGQGSEVMGQALLSRHMESMMESSQGYEERMKSLQEEGIGEDTAREEAAKTATQQYWNSFGLSAIDAAQIFTLGKTPRLASAVRGGVKESLKTGAGYLGQAATEGFEESWQYVVGKEADYMAERNLGLEESSEFGDRLADYMSDDEFKISATMGAVAGGAFHMLGPTVQKIGSSFSGNKSLDKKRIKFLKDKAEITHHINKRIEEAENAGFDDIADDLRTELNKEMAFKAAEEGNIDRWREMIESMRQTDPDEWNTNNPDFPISHEFASKADKYLQETDKIEEAYNRTAREFHYTPEVIPSVARARYNVDRYGRRSEEISSMVKEERDNLPNQSELTSEGAQIFQQTALKKQLEKYRDSLSKSISNNLVDNKESAQKELDAVDQAITAVNDEISGIEETSNRSDAQIKRDNEIIGQLDAADRLQKLGSQKRFADFARRQNEETLKELTNDKEQPKKRAQKAQEKQQESERILNETVEDPDNPPQEGDYVEFDSWPYIYRGSYKNSNGDTMHKLAHFDKPTTDLLLNDEKFNNKVTRRKDKQEDQNQEKEASNSEDVNEYSAEYARQDTQEQKELENTIADKIINDEPLTDHEEMVYDENSERISGIVDEKRAKQQGQQEEETATPEETQEEEPVQDVKEQGEERPFVSDPKTYGQKEEKNPVRVIEVDGKNVHVKQLPDNGSWVEVIKDEEGSWIQTDILGSNLQEAKNKLADKYPRIKQTQQQPERPKKEKTNEDYVVESQQAVSEAESGNKEPEPDNQGYEVKEESALGNALSVAWHSAEDPQAKEDFKSEENKARTKFLEDPLNTLVGQDVELSIDTALMSEIPDRKVTLSDGTQTTWGQLRKKIDQGEAFDASEVGKLPVRVRLLDDQGNVVRFNSDGKLDSEGYDTIGYIHDDNYWNFNPKRRDQQAEQVRNTKAEVLANYKEGFTTKSRVEQKSGGHYNKQDNYVRASTALAGTPYQNTEDVKLTVLGSNLQYLDAPSQEEADLKGFTGNPDNVGGVFLKVEDAAGEAMPVMMGVDRLTDGAADLLFDAYSRLITDSRINSQISEDIRERISNPGEDQQLQALQKILGLDQDSSKNLKYKDLLDNITVQGKNFTKGKKAGVLYYESGNIYFGPNKIRKDNLTEESRKKFRNHVKRYKRFNVRLDKLNKDNTYKQALLDHVLTSDIRPEASSVFIQPTIVLESGSNVSGEGSHNQPDAEITSDAEKKINQDVSNIDQSVENQELSEEEKLKRIRDEIDKKDSDIDSFGLYRSAQERETSYDVEDIESMRKWLKDKIGIDPVIVEDLIKVNQKGDAAYGLFANAGITLSRQAEKGTGYHEAFHAVSQLYLNENERKEIYDEAAELFNIDRSNEIQLEENLAEMFRRYMLSRVEGGIPGKIREFFDAIVRVVRNIFNNPSVRDQVFNNIRKGKYAQTPPQDVITGNFTSGPLYRLAGFTNEELNEWRDALAFMAVKHSKIESVNDVDNLTFDYIKPELRSHMDKQMKAGNEQTAYQYLKVLDNYDGIIEEVKHKLNEMGIPVKEDQNKLIEEEDEKSDWDNLKSHHTVSEKATLTDNVKFAVSILPQMEYDAQGNPRYVTGRNSGLPLFNDFNASWKFLLFHMADTVQSTNPNDNSSEDGFELMMDKLDELISVKPEFRFLKEHISKWDNHQKTKFFSSMHVTMEDYQFTIINKQSPNSGYNFRIGSATRNAVFRGVLNKWYDSFRENLVKGDDTLNLDKVNQITKNYEELMTKVSSNVKKKDPTSYYNHISELTEILNNAGVNISQQGLLNAIQFKTNSKDVYEGISDVVRSNSFGLVNVFKKEGSLRTKAKNESSIYNEDGSLNSPISNERSIRRLAEAESEVNPDLSDLNILGPEGNRYYPFVQHNYITKKVAEIKKNPRKVEELLTDPWNQGSLLLEWLNQSEENRRKFDSHVYNNFRESNTSDPGSDYENLMPPDDFADRINKVLRGYYPALTPGDKSRFYYFSGPSPMKVDLALNEDGSYSVQSTEVVDRLGYYVLDELARIEKAYLDVFGDENVNPLPPEQLINHYHVEIDEQTGEIKTDENGEWVKGNAFKMQLFPELEYGTPLAESIGLFRTEGSKQGRPFTRSTQFLENNELRSYLRNKLDSIVTDTIQRAESYNIVQTKDGKRLNNGIDPGTLKKYRDESDTVGEAVDKALADFAVNSFIFNIEQTKLFTGDPAYYKHSDDFIKRISGSSGPGEHLRIFKDDEGNWEVRPNFNVSVAGNVIVNKHADEIEQSLIRSGDTQEAAKKKADSFRKTNQTDAQAWITVDRWAEIMKGLNMWNDTLDKALPDIKKGKALPDDVYLQPIKGQHFELNLRDRGNAVPTFLKYSQAVLFPALTKNTSLDDLRIKMENAKVDGKEGIDEMVVVDGIKSGQQGISKITDDEGNLLPSDQLNLNSFSLSNNHWKLQNRNSTKGIHEDTMIGTQVKEIILDKLTSEQQFDTSEGEFNGSELARTIFATESAMSDNMAERLSNDLGVSTGSPGMTNMERLRKLIKDSIGEEYMTEQLSEMLDKDVPLEALPQYRKIVQNKVASLIEKNNIRLQGLGGGLIQMSNFGFQPKKSQELTEEEKSRINYLVTEDELKPPRIIQDENGNNIAKPGQVFIPHKIVEELKQHPENKELSNEEIIEKIKSDSELMKGVMYRIPTQGTPVLDSVEVVGILPPESGDTIMAYTEITNKTGSDFDIDKMSIMLPYYRIDKDGYPFKEEFYDNRFSPEERYNEKFYEFRKTPAGKQIAREVLEESYQGELDSLQSLLEEYSNEDYYQEVIQDADNRIDKLNNLISSYEDVIPEASSDSSVLSQMTLRGERQLEKQRIFDSIEELRNLRSKRQELIEQLRQIRQDIDNEVFSRALEKNLFPEFEVFSNYSTEEQNPYRNLHNRLLDHYYNILNHPDFYKYKMDPLEDIPHTEIAEEIREMKGITEGESGIELFSPTKQLDIKNRFMLGRATVGQAVNHVSDHVISQHVDMKLHQQAGPVKFQKGEESISLSENTNPSGESIIENLYGFVSGSVDIANDPWISYINSNTFTNPVLFMGLRAQVDREVMMKFISQPGIEEVTKRYFNRQSRIAGGSGFVNIQQIGEEVIQEYMNQVTNPESVGATDYTIEELDRGLKGSLDNDTALMRQAAYINSFLELKNSIAPSLTNMIQASRMNSNGYGQDSVDAMILDNKIRKAVEDKVISGFDQKLEQTAKNAYMRNSLGFHDRSMPGIFMGASQEFRHLANRIATQIGKTPLVSKNLAEKIHNGYYSYLNANFDFFDISSEEGRQMLFDTDESDSIATRFTKLLKDPEFANNRLFNHLTVSGNNETGRFIIPSYSGTLSTPVKDDLTNEWRNLINDPRKQVSDFAKDLVKHAFLTSGFGYNLNAFHDLIPLSFLEELGYFDHVAEYISNPQYSLSERFQPYYFKNNWSDGSVVPKIFNPQGMREDPNKINVVDTNISISEAIELNPELTPSIKAGKTVEGLDHFMPYINYNGDLFAYAGSRNIKENMLSAVYVRTNKLGYSDGKQKIIEYRSSEEGHKKSMIPENNVKLSDETRGLVATLQDQGDAVDSSNDQSYKEEKLVTTYSEKDQGIYSDQGLKQYNLEETVEASNDSIKFSSRSGETSWLSNFEKLSSPIMENLEGDLLENTLEYYTVEAYYQAQKTSNVSEKRKFTGKEVTGKKAKQLGKNVSIRKDWEQIKFDVMREGVRQKFNNNTELKKKLLNTGNKQLVEWNSWGDKTWGITSNDGRGKNALGKILEEYRDSQREFSQKTVRNEQEQEIVGWFEGLSSEDKAIAGNLGDLLAQFRNNSDIAHSGEFIRGIQRNISCKKGGS